MNLHTIIDNSHQFIDYFIYPGISIDEKRRRHLLVVLNIVNLFICGMFTVTSYRTEGIFSSNTLMPLISIIVSVFLLFTIRLVHRIGFIFYSSIFFYLTAVLYVVAIGADHGNTYIWLYPFPMFTYFMVGHHQGKFYVLGSWMGATLLMWLNLDARVYSIKSLLTFITSYALIWILAHSIEQSRWYYYHQSPAFTQLFGDTLLYRFTPTGILLWLAIIVVLGVAASWLPARNATRVSVRESLAYQG